MYGFWCESISPPQYDFSLDLGHHFAAIGSTCAPLVCQSVIATGIAWSHFYFGSLVLSGISSILAFCAFYPSVTEIERDVLRERRGDETSQETDTLEKEPKLNRLEVPTPKRPLACPSYQEMW